MYSIWLTEEPTITIDDDKITGVDDAVKVLPSVLENLLFHHETKLDCQRRVP